ncbi:YeiH family protein [Candidatus Marinarcus aquaticus]|uniref:YeiH family putative sulfate export transporter n=1 Tax=Candidatus Marinarcus aquaticus TaxID=2044504 RepID=A0A4Q0XS33_9BACT|nr:YeiH family protein [Candidatus Marinarcus aquaticus]RXJ60327.1 YeiH family putative sulfate export transporter [Candidatus Marinarcus aquaticus]
MRQKQFISVVIIALLASFSIFVSHIDVIQTLSISPLIIAILLGIVLIHIMKKKWSDYLHYGMALSTKQVLRLGIVLYGFRLTVQNIFEVGLGGFMFALFIVASTFIIGYIIGIKVLNMDNEITILTAAGSSICGAAAVLATESVLKSEAYKSAVAVSTVVIFGSIAMVVYPSLYQIGWFDLDAHTFGLFLGGTLHEVAHVVAAGNAVNNEVANSAVIEKMIRVILLAPFLLVLVFVGIKQSTESEKKKVVVPWFAVIFIVVIGFNSLSIMPLKAVEYINDFDTFLLTMAMLALGLQTHVSKFTSVGIKPFILAGVLFGWLMLAGYIVVQLIV